MLNHRQQYARRRYTPATSSRGPTEIGATHADKIGRSQPGAGNMHDMKGGAEPDGTIPSKVVDKKIQEREARGGHRRWYNVKGAAKESEA